MIIALNPCIRYLKHGWDDGCNVFITEARETHLLSPACTYVLEALEQGPISYEKLLSQLHLLLDGLKDQELYNLLSEIIDSLGGIGLLEAHEEES